MIGRPKTKVAIKCEFCCCEFEKKPSDIKRSKHHFCCYECRVNYLNNNKKKLICECCGKEFETNNKRLKKYCSRTCFNESKGKMHFGKTACECIACGKTFERPASYIARNLDRRCYCSKKCRKKEHNPNWNPDRLSLKTTENKRIRSSTLMEQWRKSVFERDNYTCVLCGKHGGILNGHHIKRIVDAPNLVYNVNNGVTLCECPCHKQVNGAESQYEPQFLSYINLRRLPIVDCYSQA